VWMLREALSDIQASGHRVVQTVYVQAGSFHRAHGPEEMRPVGESEVVQGVAAMCESGIYGSPTIGAAIVGTADLRHPNIEAVLKAHMRSRNFVGIRMQRRFKCPVLMGLHDHQFDHGIKLMEKFGLSYDVWQTSTEERDYGSVRRVISLARMYPKVTIVLNHLGCAVGPAMSSTELSCWKQDLAELASTCANVVCKVGGIQMPVNGFGFEARDMPIGSEELCKLTLPFYGHAIDCFGPRRCMFESNFPVDKESVSYRVLWNMFKRLATAKQLSEEDKRFIFHDTAARVYKLPLLGAPLSSL